MSINGPILSQLSNQKKVELPSLTYDMRKVAANGLSLRNIFHIQEFLVVLSEMSQKDE